MNSTTDQKIDERWHCSVCNTVFEEPDAGKTTLFGICPNCDSEHIHHVGTGCVEMAKNEWRNDSTGSY